MKLGEVANHVIAFLQNHTDQEYTANTLLMHIGLPLREKRRLYDVIEVLSCVGLVGIRKDSRKRYFRWKLSNLSPAPAEIDLELPADPLFHEAGTILHLLLHLGPGAFQELSNDSSLAMLERDIKRTVWGANAVSVVRVSLQNQQGRILKETSHKAIPAEIY